MPFYFGPTVAVSGAGSTAVLGPWVVFDLSTIPAWLTRGATGVVYYRNLGTWHWASAGFMGPSTVLHWAESLFGGIPAEADTFYWDLAPGVVGTVRFGREALAPS